MISIKSNQIFNFFFFISHLFTYKTKKKRKSRCTLVIQYTRDIYLVTYLWTQKLQKDCKSLNLPSKESELHTEGYLLGDSMHVRIIAFLFKTVIYISGFIQDIEASWFFKEYKVCNPSNRDGLTTFTGFKITRKYKIEAVMPTSMLFMSIAHCNHGKVDYEKTTRMSSNHDINWDQPFCMIKPNLGTKLRDLPEDIPQNLDNRELESQGSLNLTLGNMVANNPKEAKGRTEIIGGNATAQTRTKIKDNFIPIKNFINTLADKTVQLFIGGNRKHINYSGLKESSHLNDLQLSSIQSSLEWESRNLVCYKIARRRKYAKRDILYYMPHTFVGALFECQLSTEDKRYLFQNLSTIDLFQFHNFDIKCDRSLSRALKPLVAEDSTKQWFERKETSFIQTIPYLTTATPYNLRFKLSDTNDMFQHTWASDIDVNEEYNYNEFEVNLISQAIAKSANHVNKLLMTRPLFKLSKTNSLHSYDNDDEDEDGNERQEFVNSRYNRMRDKFDKFDIDQRVSLIISSILGKKDIFNLFQSLQAPWDVISDK